MLGIVIDVNIWKSESNGGHQRESRSSYNILPLTVKMITLIYINMIDGE